jgi:hypothetical protein
VPESISSPKGITLRPNMLATASVGGLIAITLFPVTNTGLALLGDDGRDSSPRKMAPPVRGPMTALI